MSVDEFYDMLPRYFFNKMDGFFELEQLRERGAWERTRWQTCYLLNIHIERNKQIKLKDLIKFGWEKDDKKDKIEYNKLKNKAEYIKKMEEHGNR